MKSDVGQERRLRRLLIGALAEPDPARSLERLRELCHRYAEQPGVPDRPSSPAVQDMITLAEALTWLDDPTDDRTPPAGAERLTTLSIASDAGDRLGYAIGRMRLIEGDARAAGEILVPLADRHPERPGWAYHAAWALLLRGDRHGAGRRFAAMRASPEAWPIGCMVLDADPGAAADLDIPWALRAAPPAYADVVAARMALVQGEPLPAEPSWEPGHASLEEDLEALRTVLGLRFAARRYEALAEAMALPLFQRLPRADRLLWWGVAALAAEPEEGRRRLAQAVELGHDRAAVALAVHDCRGGRVDAAARLLQRFSWRTDPKMELLRACLEAWGGHERRAVARLEPLAATGSSRAHYVLGTVHLALAAAAPPDDARQHMRRAATAFAAAGEHPTRPPPPGLPPRTTMALHVAAAAGAAEDDQNHCLDLLIPALGHDPADLGRLMDLARVVPALCVRAARGPTGPPPALTRLVRRLAESHEGALDTLTLARCTTALLDYETADLVWRRTQADQADARGAVAVEHARYLSHVAAVVRPEDPMRAVGLLRQAGELLGEQERGERASRELSAGRLRDAAYALESRVCVDRLLTHLLPVAPGEYRPGRYRVLEEVIDADAALRRALVAGDAAAIGGAWSAALTGRGDVRLHHTLAVLYREHAGAGGPALVAATVLWCVLLATEEFWERLGDRSAERALRRRAVRELLALNADRGAGALAEGDTDTARLHLRCLDACRSGAGPMRELWDGFGAVSGLRPAGEPLAEISGIAGEIMDDWCAKVIGAATDRVEDPWLIEELPGNVRAAYGAGIDRLEPFTALGVPVARALRAGLEWHNDWCFDLYTRGEKVEIVKVLVSAGRFAGRLSPQSAKNTGYEPENQALSRYFMFRGFVAVDDGRAVREYDEALAWNPANDNARELLVSALLRLGEVCAERGEFAAAREHGEKARRLASGGGTASEFLAGLAERESEYENAARQQVMATLYDDEDFERSLHEPDRMLERSRLTETADGWKPLIYLHQAEDAAARHDFAAADVDFAQAYVMSPDPEEREHIARRWSSALVSHAMTLLSGTPRGSVLGETLTECRRLLETAIRLHPAGSPVAVRALRTIERLEGRR